MEHWLAKRLSALLCVKAIVTLALTGAFVYLAVTNRMSQDMMTIYAVIISFYFGTQHERVPEGGRV
ncbi:MAG: hypothetical protein PUB51_05395 [Oscillospiraceae bacterium]|nr:hypothetical protein [Oscillospiraceae bacterium]